jgi:GNAT superfamily N-acetyltransferase
VTDQAWKTMHDDLAPAAVAAAIEANGAEFLIAMGRAGGGEERDDHLRWTIGGSPIDYHNAIVGARLDAGNAGAGIAAAVACLRVHGVPGTWHLGPGMTPADLGQRLVDQGFAHAGDEIGMAADLDALERPPIPTGLVISRVTAPRDLEVWAETLGKGFGEGPAEASWVGEIYSRLGLENPAWRHYLGRLDGEPVATATMFLGAGVAGIYFVFTVPDARRRGIGAALTVAPLLEARALGHRLGVLAASTMGEPVYRCIGFREYCLGALERGAGVALFGMDQGRVARPDADDLHDHFLVLGAVIVVRPGGMHHVAPRLERHGLVGIEVVSFARVPSARHHDDVTVLGMPVRPRHRARRELGAHHVDPRLRRITLDDGKLHAFVPRPVLPDDLVRRDTDKASLVLVVSGAGVDREQGQGHSHGNENRCGRSHVVLLL